MSIAACWRWWCSCWLVGLCKLWMRRLDLFWMTTLEWQVLLFRGFLLLTSFWEFINWFFTFSIYFFNNCILEWWLDGRCGHQVNRLTFCFKLGKVLEKFYGNSVCHSVPHSRGLTIRPPDISFGAVHISTVRSPCMRVGVNYYVLPIYSFC